MAPEMMNELLIRATKAHGRTDSTGLGIRKHVLVGRRAAWFFKGRDARLMARMGRLRVHSVPYTVMRSFVEL